MQNVWSDSQLWKMEKGKKTERKCDADEMMRQTQKDLEQGEERPEEHEVAEDLEEHCHEHTAEVSYRIRVTHTTEFAVNSYGLSLNSPPG